MSSDRVPDAPKTTITFGRYVRPETVQNVAEQEAEVPDPVVFQPYVPDATHAPSPPFDPAVLTKGLFVILTFLLGALTMHFIAGPSSTATASVAPAVEQPTPAAQTAPVATPELLEQAVRASVEQDVTRGNAGDLITLTGGMSQASPDPLTMQEILLGLSPKPNIDAAAEQEQKVVTRDKLQLLREGVLAGKYTVKTIKRNGQERLCLRLPHAKVSQDEAADLIEQAAARGEIFLPDSVATSDGSYDADTLLFNLVQTSLANDGTAEGAAAAQEMSRRAFAASQAKTKKVSGQRIYVVEAGDSLAYISLQFYGRPSDYIKIFEANQPKIKSPDQIQIGQRLIIPS